MKDFTPAPRDAATVNHPAVEALRRFFKAMNKWERQMIAKNFRSRSDFNRRGKGLLGELREIYEQFCEPGAAPERLTEMNWGYDTPDYDPKNEKVTSVRVGRNKVVIETRMTGKYEFNMRYELTRLSDEWRLRGHRECFTSSDLLGGPKKWHYCQL